MNDQRLYLKHNLNARAIQSLKGEAIQVDRDVGALLVSMRSPKPMHSFARCDPEPLRGGQST